MFAHNFKEMASRLAARFGGPADDYEDELRRYWAGKVALVWCLEDVRAVLPGLTRDECLEILYKLPDADADRGVDWHYIRDLGLVHFGGRAVDTAAIRGQVEDYAQRLAAAGDVDGFEAAFGTRDIGTPLAEFDDDEIEEIWREFVLEGDG